MTDFFFFLFAAMAVLSALFMVTQKNPVASVLFLVVTFFSLSGLFVILDAHFIAAVQVIVNAGAIMVLFLFVIMLLNLGSPDLGDFRKGLARILAGSVAVALLAVVARVFLLAAEGETAARRSALDALLADRGAVAAVAEPLFTRHLVAFEVTSVLLLAAIVGAIVLARRQAP